MSTGELEGLHSSGKGLGMDGTEEEKDSALALQEFGQTERVKITWEETNHDQ